MSTTSSPPRPSDAPREGPAPLPAERSRLIPMAPGRMWLQDLGPLAPERTDEVPALLLHSLLVTGWDFRFLAESWSPRRRVLVPDLFGCGSSDRPAAADAAGYGFEWHAELLARMLDRLPDLSGRERDDHPGIDLVGHGYGGAIAVALAHKLMRVGSPHRVGVRRLILIAPHLVPVDAPIALPGPVPALRRAWRWVGFAPLVLRTAFRRADLRRFLRRSLSTEELLDHEPLADDVDVYWDRLCRDGGLEAVEAMLRQLDDLHQHEPGGTRQRLIEACQTIEGLRTPTMLVWGDRDAIVPTAMSERTAGLLPSSALRIIEGCGHAPQRERPEALLRALDAPSAW
ncbi:Alpha/beta hydrolase fold protein [Plesiocystis pacifica SIR-1]|uniref:Alpha/beta hydrolase fold protein n=1 Tax=Plesiocystis pacifica SIR-1 TaxID=391625 RepID=A6G435_9BACT|nr:alpha/beta fold hydrolase [Plesiocystis pacifica]EDM79358.1 Alpha/beta hydrolase fold protein [Plesiocystis pacifica SIR-1]